MPQHRSEPELNLGDRVTITGTVTKQNEFVSGWTVRYQDAGVPGFAGYAYTKPEQPRDTFHPRAEGIIVGKRRYRSMQMDEGIWRPDGVQDFTAYLVAWHIRRNPVIVREDQLTRTESSS